MHTIELTNFPDVPPGETSRFLKFDQDPTVSVGQLYLAKSEFKRTGKPTPRRIKKVTVEYE